MKRLYFICLLLTLGSTLSAQMLPIDFENDVTTSDFVDFDGGLGTVVANPMMDAVNTSLQVGQIIRDGGEIFAGSKIVLSNNLDFSVLTKISMDVYSTAPAGTTVKFKLEGSGGAVDVDAVTTVSGSWETLEWVFAGTSNDLNEVVFMFDFGNVGDGSINSTFYFDNVEQVTGPPAPVPVSLPINFENDVVSSDFLSFGGAAASVIPNPQIDAINPSATVGQIVKNSGEFWAGSFLRTASDIDLSTNWVFSMKIFTTAPIGTRIKLELENDGIKTNVDYVTTTSGSWETAAWNFFGATSDNDTIIVLFDYGNVGNGSATSTLLFDDIELITGASIPPATAKSLPIDFETNFETSDLRDFYGGESDVIANPQIDAINPSATVGRFIRSGGAPWAQSRIILNDFLDFNANDGISMKIYTDAPVGTQLKFKVHNDGDTFANERDVLTTVTGAWETYTWNFIGDPPVYDRITLMLGYDRPNDASVNATFLFDDITLIPAVLSLDNVADEHLSLYPNPADHFVHINSHQSLITNLVITNVLGAQVERFAVNSVDFQWDTTVYSSGVYFATIYTDNEMNVIKFIIK